MSRQRVVWASALLTALLLVPSTSAAGLTGLALGKSGSYVGIHLESNTGGAVEGPDDCAPLIQVQITQYGGRAIDDQVNTLQVIVPNDYTFQALRNVDQDSSEEAERHVTVELAVNIAWHLEYIVWDPLPEELYIPIPDALAMLDDGQIGDGDLGRLTTSCDPTTQVREKIEQYTGLGGPHQYRWYSPVPRDDGWAPTHASTKIQIATDEQSVQWPPHDEGESYTAEVWNTLDQSIQNRIDGYGIDDPTLQSIWENQQSQTN